MPTRAKPPNPSRINGGQKGLFRSDRKWMIRLAGNSGFRVVSRVYPANQFAVEKAESRARDITRRTGRFDLEDHVPYYYRVREAIHTVQTRRRYSPPSKRAGPGPI